MPPIDLKAPENGLGGRDRFRDREAPGSKSRAPDHFCIQNRRFSRLSGVGGSQPGHNFLGNYRDLGVR
jgi:hypothetical protein